MNVNSFCEKTLSGVDMKLKKLILIIFIGGIFAQTKIHLDSEWKFIQGDSLSYAKAEYNSKNWRDIRVDKIWENQGYDPYDGYAWYRIKVFLPRSLIKAAYLKDSLKINLGKINNFDQSFLNGQIFGINGKNASSDSQVNNEFTKAPQGYWDLERVYTLPVNDPRIKWDQENIIAVRVFDEGGQGGLWSGQQYISMTRLPDYLKTTIKNNPYILKNNLIRKEFELKNCSEIYKLEGKLKILAVNKLNNQLVYNEEESVVLKPGEKLMKVFTTAQIDQSLKVTYSCEFNDCPDNLIVEEETPYILTPGPEDKPRINGPSVYGQSPGKPFLFKVPASGKKPVEFIAEELPEGLSLDKNTGIISGKVNVSGIYKVKIAAINHFGKDEKIIEFTIGENKLALTPPMGWNSWNCWGLFVDENKVVASARVFIEKGLQDHGWSFINVDDGWEIKGDSDLPKRFNDGKIITNEKFKNMKDLGDSIHSMGLKFGIYSSPGPLTCGGYTASYKHEITDALSYSEWGVDYLKYDWCSYDQIAKDTSLAELKKPYFIMKDALSKVDRDVVYSLCQYGMGKVWNWGNEVGGNLWRTTGDITDTWESMKNIGFNQIENAAFARPGNWNDPDMLVVGWVGWGPNLHPTRLTPDEQYTHISLWALLSAPLLIGCDLERLDDFTINLLTNDEVLAVNQDREGKQAVPVIKQGDIQIWVKELYDGGKAVGIFNLGESSTDYELIFDSINLTGNKEIVDLWRNKILVSGVDRYKFRVPSHGVVLTKIK